MKRWTKLMPVVGLALALLLGWAPESLAAQEAVVSTQSLELNGQGAKTAAYNIEGNNYFKLRDVAAILVGTDYGFAVDYDGETQTVAIRSKAAYEKDPQDLMDLGTATQEAVVSSQKMTLDGKVIQPKAYNINGNNYVKLRDLGEVIGFYVGYDEAKNAILIDTTKPYVKETQENTPEPAPAEEPANVEGHLTYGVQSAAGLSLRVVTVPNVPNIRFAVVKGNDALVGSEPFGAMIQRFGPKAAINGNFFDAYKTLTPYSTIVRNGELLKMVGHDPGFYVTADGRRGVVSSSQATLTLTANGTPFSAWYQNHTPVNDSSGIYVFTPLYGPNVELNGGSYAAVSGGKVVDAQLAAGQVNIPQDGYLIYFGKDSGAVSYIQSHVPVGADVAVQTVFKAPELQGKEVVQMVAAGPLLVKDGKLAVEESLANYSEAKILTQAAQRSAIGVKADQTVLMVTATASVRQLAAAMLELGCVEATNLDGGASSALYVNGNTVTAPGRNLNTVLMIFE